MATTLIGGNETGLLDSTRLLLNRNDQAREGVLGHGEQSFINVANGNLVMQQRDVYMPSLGEDFGLVRTYNSRGLPSDAHQHEDARWTFSTFVRLNERHDTGTTYFEVEYGDGSTFEYRLNPATGLYESVDGAGAFETLRDLGVNTPGITAYELTRADQTKLSFDKQGHLLSSVDTNGVRMDYFYASDRLVQVRDDTGHTINYEYENGVLHRLTNETGLVLVEYRYTSGRLSEVIDREGHSTKYFYTNDGFLNRIQLPSAQDANGDGVPETFATRELLIEYEDVNWRGDQQGKGKVVTRVTDAEGGVTTFDYSFEFTTPGANHDGKGHLKRVDTTTTTFYAVNAGALTTTQTTTTTVTVPPYYTVRAGDTWQAIATLLYGTPNAASALQAALNNPALTTGAELTGFPASLSYTETTTVAVPPYYTVQVGDTWATIALAVYGTSDAEAITALQSALGNPALAAGTRLTVPSTITYTPGSVTAGANAAVLSTTVTTTNTYNLNSGALTTPPTSGWSASATLVSSSSSNATAPQIRYDQNGNGVAVWVVGTDLFYSRYTKSTDTWTAAQTLDGTLTGTPSQPHLSMSANGNALVTWLQNNTVYARRFIGGAWDGSGTIPVLGTSAATFTPVGAINDSGRAVVAFSVFNGSFFTQDLAVSVYNGSAWQSGGTALDDVGGTKTSSVFDPKVAIDSLGNATVLWRQRAAGETVETAFLSRYTASTNAWSTPDGTALENTLTAVSAASIAFDGDGNGLAIWLQGSTLFAKSYTRSTNSWSATATTLATSASGLPHLSMSTNGNALATWVSGTDIVARRYAAGAWLGTGAEAVENATGAASSPVGSINNLGQAAVVFVQASGSTNNVLVNRFTAGAWQSATLVESSGNAVAATMTPSVAIDSNGNIGSVWLQKTGNGAQATDGVFRNRYVSGDPYYTIPSGATWSSIAQALYGSSAPASQLQTALGNPPLTANNRLTGFPPTVTVTTTTTVAPYYTVQSADTWSSIAQTVYGDAAAAGALQAALGNPALTAGLQLTVPASLTYSRVVASANGAALSTSDTQTTNQPLNPAAGGWAGPISLDTGTWANSPEIQFDGNGNGIAVWTQAGDNVARRYDKASNTWGSPVVLNSPADLVNPPGLYVDPSGNAIVTWSQSNNGLNYGVYARRYSAATNTWLGTAELVDTNSSTGLAPVAAINASGQAIVAWRPIDGSAANIRVSRYTGSAWSGTVLIESSGNSAFAPKVALDAAGNATVVWKQSDGTADSIYLNRYDSATNTWLGPSLPLESSGVAAASPQIQFDQSGSGFAAWIQGGSLYARQYNKASNTWQPAVDLDSGTNPVSAYSLDVDASGNAIVTWTEAWTDVALETTYFNAYARRYSAASGSWLGAELMAGNLTQAFTPAGAVNASGQAVVMWIQYTGGSGVLQANRYTGAGWGGATTVDINNTVGVSRYGVALDAAGNASVVWDTYDDSFNTLSHVFVNRFISGAGSYTVQAGDTWASIAQLLYGTSAGASALQQALGNPALTAGGQLTGFPPTLSVTSTITVPPYYTVQAGDTWATIAQAVYGSGAANAVQALRDALGNPALVAGAKLNVPATLAYSGSGSVTRTANAAVLTSTETQTNTVQVALNAGALSTTKTGSQTAPVPPYYAVQAGDTWESIASLLYGSVNVADELRAAFGNPALNPGLELAAFPLMLSSTDASPAATSTDKFFLGGTTRVVDALGNNRAFSNDAEYQAWRVANGYYAVYDATITNPSFLAQVEAIRQAHSLTYSYRANGLMTEVVDQQGLHTLYKYDNRENLIAVTDRNGWGAANSDAPDFRRLRAELGYVTTGGAGKLAADLTSAEREAILAKFTTTFTYDERGNLSSRIDAEGNRATFTYTAFNKLASETSAVGHALVSSDEPLYQQQRVALGFAALVANLSNADKLALLARNTATYQYDARQNLIKRTDAGGDITRFEYDANGNLSRSIVFLDRNDLVTPAKQQVRQFFYDQFGNNIETVDGEGNHTRSDYDIFGNLLRVIDGNGGVTTFTYDDDNRLLTITDPEGHVTVNAYDAVGNRIAVTDANGHAVTRLFDRNNMLLAVIDPSVTAPAQDRITRHAYDVTGNRTSVTDAEGRTTTYTYSARRELVAITTPEVAGPDGAPRRYTTTLAYDGESNRIRTTNNNGFTTELAYTRDNLVRSQTDPIGQVTRFEYDANRNQVTIIAGAQLPELRRQILRFSYDAENQLIRQTDAEGNVTIFAYDAPGNRARVIDANGNPTDFEYDRNNRLVKEIRPAVIDPRTGVLTRYTVLHQYDANGNEIVTTDENGHVTRFSFDRDNRTVMVEDANQIKTVFTYDSRHNRTSVQIGVQAHIDAERHVVVDSTVDARVTTHTYDEFNQLIATTDGVGNALTTSDSPLYRELRTNLGFAASVAQLTTADKQALKERFSEHYTYDRVGNYTSTTDHLDRVTAFTYDALNRQTIRVADQGGINATTRFAYDGNGNRVKETDALNRVTTHSYDAVNRLVDTTDALGVVTHRDYDSFGNLIARTRAQGTPEARTNQYEYDLNNRLVRQTDPEGHTETYVYDPVGNRLRVIDARLNRTEYFYDALNRNIKIIDPLLFETKFEYDGVGNRISLIDPRGGVQRLTYDAGNRLIQIQDAENRKTSFTYDVRGNRIVQTTGLTDNPATSVPETTTFEYDAEGNLRSVTDAEGNVTRHAFDQVYNRIRTTDGNGHVTTYAFDALNRQIQITDAENGVTRFTYDAVGNRLTHTDALGRITRYDYDARNQLITQTAPDLVQTRFAYDKVGNRVDITRAFGTPEAQHTSFVYDKDDRLTATIDALGNGLAESDSAEYRALRTELGYPAQLALLTEAQKAALRALHTSRNEYDATHNVTKTIDALGRATTYQYDANNRVTRITDPLGGITEYRYDGNGNRVQVIDALGNRTTTYFNADNEVVLAADAEGGLTSFAYDANGNRIRMTRFATVLAAPADPNVVPTPVADPAKDETSHYLYDRNNRLVRTIDGEGYVVDTQYDAVGSVVATKGYANKLVINPALPLAGQVPAPHADDRLTQFAYDNVNRLVRRIDAEGFHTAYRYDAVGNRVEQTRFLDPVDFNDPAKRQVTAYEYDAVNRLTLETSSLGVQTRHAYDLVGNRLSTTEAFGRPEARSWLYSYDDLNRAVSETNPEGTVTRFVYDAVGQLRQKVEAAGLAAQRTTLNHYDANGRLTDRTNPDGTLTRYAYDALGNLRRQTDAADSPDSRDTAYTYDRNSRLKSETVADGSPVAITRRYEYDAFGNRTSETIAPDTADARVTRNEYDRVNHLVAQTDGNGIVTRFTYDTFGNVIRREITGQTLGLGGTPVTRTDATIFAYDGRDLLERETNAAGNVRTRAYDAVGNLRFETRGAGTAAASVTEYRYDLGNRLLEKLVDPAGLALSTRYEYDARNNLVAEIDANAQRSTSRYDAMNRVIEVTDGIGFSTSFAYDRFGNQTALTTGQYFGTDPQKAALAMPATTRFEYDAMNRMTSQTDALGVITTFAYDRRGNRTQKVEAFGTPDQRTCIYRYDLVDRLVDETQPAGTVVHQAYNAAGELSAKTVDFGTGVQFKNATTRYAYDAGGRLASETDPVGSVTRYDYDSFGNRIRVTRGFGTPAARSTELVYDGAQRLIQEIVDPTGLRLTTRYEYDARGNQTALVNANGQRGETVYDAGDRVVWQRDAEGNITRFIRDGRGNKREEIHYATPGAFLPLGQIPASNGLDRRVQFNYDAKDRLLERIDARGVVNRLRYDAVGNVLENTENATSLFGAGPRTKTYKYSLANLVIEQVEPNGLKTTFEYDRVYNMTRKIAENRWLDTLNGNVQRLELQVCEYRYDLNNRMIEEITDPAGLNLRKSWRYDALGDRIADTDPNGNTTRTWFDAAGRPIFTVDPLGHAKEARFDAVGNLLLAIQYANPVSTAGLVDHTPPSVVADPNNDRTVEYVYDKADRRTQTKLDAVRVFVGGMWVDGHRPTTTDAYDGVGNVVRQTDANGNTAYHYFDGNGLETGTIDAEGFLTVNKFDAVGNKMSETLYFDRQPLTAAQKETLDLRSYAPVGEGRLIEHVFDLGNNEVETRYPSADLFIGGQNSTPAMRVNRTFDALGQMLTETVMHAANDLAPAYKVMTFDAAGRIASVIDARAQELIQSDAPYFVELRGGKLAAQLTEAEKQAIRAQYTTTYAYDGKNNMREKVESDHVTTFEYDRANRNTRVILPALDTATVDASGNVSTATGVRPVTEIGYDAAGNKVRELKADGSEILYRYDAANRQIAAIDQSNVYTEYGYDFAGSRTLMRRYFNPVANRAAPVPPAQHGADQLFQYDYDRVGHLIRERQEGDFATAADNRVGTFGYDANGNQVEVIDGRGFTSRMSYDALNRVVEQQNPNGGISVTQYDALGKVAARQVGGWSAPTITGDGVTETLVSNRGAIITFATDHATSAVIQVRRAGDTGPFIAFGDENARETAHAVKLSGLAADTLYEYHVVAKDSFGFTLTSAARTFRTGVGVEAAVLSNLRPVTGSTTEFEADLHFALATPVQGLVVAVGRAGGDVLSLTNETLFTPVQQADGSYSVTLRFTDPATAFFQIRWSSGASTFSTETSQVQQRQALRVFDGRLRAVSAGNGNFNLSVTWDLSTAFAANEIKSYIDPLTGQTRYNVYVGVTLNDAQTPTFVEALMPGSDGIFHADFNNIVDTPRKLHFYYVMPDGSLVNAGPLSVPTLNGLDQRHQRIELAFPDLDTTGATLVFRYRLQGTTIWNTLPAAAVSGLSVNVLGLTEGNYEYQADLTRGGAVLRTSAGSFKLREPGSVTNVVDAVGPNPVSFTVVDNLFSVAGLTPLGTGEALTLDVTDAHGVTTRYPFNTGSFDLTVLSPGDYSFRIQKTRTTGTPPVTTTLNDITGDIHIAPLVLTAAAANALSSERVLESFNRSQSFSYVPTVTTTGTNASADHLYNFYDDLGWRTFSNENGGIWTRYFFDGAGNVTKEVRFRIRDHSDPLNPHFVDTIVDLDTAPTLSRLMQDYDAAVAAHNPAAGSDTIRVIEYSFDAANNKLTETSVSLAAGRVTDEFRYDRFNNKVREVTAKGLMANGQSIEQRTEYAYDSANRLTRTTIGPFQFFDSNGNGHFDTAVTAIAYDVRGYKSTETTERGHVKRMHYDAQGRLVREWDAANTLRSDYVYDAFGRATQKTELDLSGHASVASRTSTLQYSNFDQVTAYDFAGRLTRMEYDQSGNKVAETNARGFTERYDYDAENHLVGRIDRLGNANFKSYDAYGHVISETDGNGRVTTYTIGAFGQVVSKHTTLTRGIQVAGPTPVVGGGGSGFFSKILFLLRQQAAGGGGRNLQEGAGSDTESTAYDWLGRTTQVTDSYGKNIQSGYDDADRLTRIADAAKSQTATYAYDARGLRIRETLAQGATVLRDQTNNYNSRGWLVGVDSGATVSFGGSTLSQPIHVFFRYDQAGNRVWVGDNKYAYDGDNRMLMGYDGKNNQVVEALVYDGYGNRTSIQTGGSIVTYTYNAQGEVLSGSNAEVWSYDEVGNALFHSAPNGDSQTTSYDAENRAATVSSVSGGQTQNMTNFYDGAGNLALVRNSAADFGYDEVTFRDVRYDEQRKGVENSWVNNAVGLRGQTIFTRNANGELVLLDRGRKKDAAENTVASFEYDNEDHIIARSDKPGAGTNANFFEGYAQDPDVAEQVDEFGFVRNAAEIARQAQLNGLASGVTHLQTFVYANGKPVAEASADHQLSLRKLTLQGGDPVLDAEGQVVGWTLTLQAADIVTRADGSIDRAATARNIAARAYLGYDALSAAGKVRVEHYVEGQLPALDSGIVAGARISVFGFIQLIDSIEQNVQVRTDYYVKQLGQDGMPSGQVASYIVRTNDTLQSISSIYYGSPSYWYLIAGANGLTGSEQLQEGTTLTIPNAPANNVNNANTYKVYNEAEVIGSTSPELVVIPKAPKKKKWYQKLVMVLIIVIIIVAAIFTAGAALGLMGLAAPALGAIGAAGAAFGASIGAAVGIAGLTGVAAVAAGLAAAAVVGYGIGLATSIVTQGLAIAVHLQEKFDWKAANKMGTSFAITGVSAAAGGWVSQVSGWGTTAQSFAQGGIEVASQAAQNDGKVTNWSGVALAMIPGASTAKEAGTWKDTLEFVEKNKKVVGAGLAIAEKYARGKSVNSLDWANVAAATIQGQGGVGQYLDRTGSIQWGEVGRQALGAAALAAVVGSRRGEDAALNFFGNQLGAVVRGVETEQGQYKSLQKKLTDGLLKQQELNQAFNRDVDPYERVRLLNQIAADRGEALLAAAKERKQERQMPLWLASVGGGMTDVGPMWAIPSESGLPEDSSVAGATGGAGEGAGSEPSDGTASGSAGKWIKVRRGDTLTQLAGDKETFGAMLLANGIKYPDELQEGQELFRPNPGEYDRELALQAANDFYAGRKAMPLAPTVPPARSLKPEWIPSADPNAPLSTGSGTYFLGRLADANNRGSSAVSGVLAEQKDFVQEVGQYFNIDPRSIALVMFNEAAYNARGVGGDALQIQRFKLTGDPGAGLGYGSMHTSTVGELYPDWSTRQSVIGRMNFEYAAPLVAAEIERKAAIYEQFTGGWISIRDDPVMLAWAYNTSLDNVVQSAKNAAAALSAGATSHAFDIYQNKQLGGRGMGYYAELNVPQFDSFKPTFRLPTSRVPYNFPTRP